MKYTSIATLFLGQDKYVFLRACEAKNHLTIRAVLLSECFEGRMCKNFDVTSNQSIAISKRYYK